MIRRPSCTVLCFALLATLSSARSASAQTGLVAAYSFNEGAGTTVSDSTTNSNTGTITGAAWNTAGRFGGALSFNGTSDWVTIPDVASLDLTSGMTIEAWVMPTSLAAARSVVFKERASGLCYALYASDASNLPSARIRRASDQIATARTSISAGTWVHLAATYNGSTLTIYINGVQSEKRSVSGAIATSGLPLRIGGNAARGEFFSGLIDEVRIYNRALTAAQIQTDMTTPIQPASPPPPPAPDFTIAASPASQSAVQGASATYTVTIGAVNGFTGSVSLSASGLPSGATASFSPASIAGGGTSTLTVSTSATTPAATSPLTITGTAGTLSHSASASLVVTAATVADFTIAVSPSSQSAVQGAAATYTVTVGAVNGFTGTVTFGAGGLPAGATASFSPASLAGAGTSTLTVSTASTTPAATSSLTVSGSSGTLSHSAPASLVVTPAPGFTIAASPASQSANQGNTASYTVTVTPTNGFSGTVTLAATGVPANATASFAPASVVAPGTATLSVATAATTPTGGSTLTITGTSGTTSASTTAGLTVTPPPDFTIAASPASAGAVAGGSATYTVSVSALNGFSGSVTLAVGGLPAGANGAFSPASIAPGSSATLTVTTVSSTPPGTSNLSITGTSGSLAHAAAAALVVSAPSAGPTIGIDFVGTGTAMAATESAGVVPIRNWNAATGQSRATPLALVDSTGAATGATVTWSAFGTWRTPITDVAGNARMMRGYLDTSTTSVSTVSVAGLPTGTYDVYVYVDGDNATDPRTAAYAISGAGITTTTVNLTDAANANFVSAFTLAQNSNGNYVKFTITAGGFTLTATPGTATVNKRAPLNAIEIVSAGPPVPDFSIAMSPASATVVRGGSTSYDVTVTAINGFSDAVTLTASGLPAGAAATFTPATIGGGGTATMSIATDATTPIGSSTVTVTGTAGTVAHAATASLAVTSPPVPDFTMSAQPVSGSVVAGGNVSYTVTLSALNGFAGAVALTLSGLPANATAAFTPATVAVPGSASLVVTTAATTPSGTFGLTVTGTSGSIVHTVPLSLTVTGPTFVLSGVITPSALGGAATVNLGGAAAASTSADATGAYRFTGVANGAYQVTPSKNGVTFTPANKAVTVAGADVAGVDFTAAQSPNTVTITSPASGGSVSSSFSMSATASAGVVGVQFRVDGANVGAEDTASPFSTTVTATGGSHTLTAVGRDAGGNTVTSAPVTVTVGASSGTALTLNGLTTFQAGDGFGVNINSLSWKNGELRPALDMLIDELGVQTWRVVFDMEDWEDANDNADPFTPNWTFYNALYSNAKFQNLWGTLQYMNSKGVTSGIMLSFMGRVPPWMGGPQISTTMEDEWVEMIATLLFYAKNTANVQFDMVDPMNEPDWDGLEGPQVNEVQYTRLLQKLSVRLDAMGLGSVKFVGPNTAQVTTGVDIYMPEMLGNSVVMSKLDHFGLHNYNGLSGGADARIKGSAFPSKNFWMTELSIPDQIFDLIGQGAASGIIWDAYDSVYNHAILAGSILHDGRGSTPPNDAGNLAALLSYNSTAGTYSRRPQYRQMQAFKFVSRGSVRIAASESNANITLYAYRNPATGRVTIVGRNIGASAVTLTGSMSNVGTVGSLQFYQTNNGDSFGSFTRGPDAAVTNGAFVVTVPANSYFTLTSGQ